MNEVPVNGPVRRSLLGYFMLRAVTSLAAGWMLYMVAMVMTVYDGMLSLLFQPFIAAAFSLFFTMAAFGAGLPLKIPALDRWWSSTPWYSASMAAIGLILFVAGFLNGAPTYLPSGEMVPPGLGSAVAGFGGYFLFLFSIANWPPFRWEAVGQR